MRGIVAVLLLLVLTAPGCMSDEGFAGSIEPDVELLVNDHVRMIEDYEAGTTEPEKREAATRISQARELLQTVQARAGTQAVPK